MNKQEIAKALKLSEVATEYPAHQILATFDGYGLRSFKPIDTTLWAVSRLIRWECLQIDGGLDTDALAYLARSARDKFQIIGEGIPEEYRK